ncbi:MAG TPA: hypothetical protein VFE62_21900, partial [Gemmataceae bacterium]|nr:hypothetical protein [Gemmataceae bacterium]
MSGRIRDKELLMRTFLSKRGTWLILGTALLLTIPALSRAQGQQAASKEDLVKAMNASDTRLRALFTSEEAEKGDEKHARVAAHWYLYRLTIRAYLTPATTATGPNGAEKLQREFHDKVSDFMDRRSYTSRRDRFRKMFGAELVKAMKEDILSRDPKTEATLIIHAAAMLPTMAMLRDDTVNNYLAELTKDDKSRVVQMYAVKALREVMPVPTQPDVDDVVKMPDFLKAKWRDVKTVDALRGFIEKPMDTKGMTVEEIRALTYIRREAITSLAQAKSPAVAAIPKKKMVAAPEGPVAYTLLNVLAGNVTPPPTLQEKVEAALGVCAFKYPNMADYDPQLGIYLVGRTIEDFVKDYNKDWINFTAVGGTKKLPYVAYKVDARRLKAGLKELGANTPTAHVKAAKALESAAGTPILDKIIDNYKQPDQA